MRNNIIIGFGEEAVSELGRLNLVNLLDVEEGGGAGFCQKAFVGPVPLHRAVQGPVQVALELVNM